MRRLLIAASVVLAAAAGPRGAVGGPPDVEHEWCEAYCTSLVVSCGAARGEVRGGPGCEAMYTTCMTGCLPSYPDDS
jgi:hypothetical protein